MTKLLEFPHSHFCEKARWALDFKGIPFERKSIFPGWHVRVVRKIAPRTTVPVLIHGPDVVQGSSEIISYLDKRFPSAPLAPKEREPEIVAFEKDIDKSIGESIRVMLYHRLLLDSRQVSFYFMHRSPKLQQWMFRMVYPLIAERIRAKYRINDTSCAAATSRFEQSLDRLDAIVSKQPYMFGEHFSRADITVASLLCFLCMPKEHPVPWQEVRVPEVLTVLAKHANRPTTKWVEKMYQTHRLTTTDRNAAK